MSNDALRDVLHDEIDHAEEMRNRAEALVRKVFKNNFAMVMNEVDDPTRGLEILAAMVEDELTDLSTETFKTSAELAGRRSAAASSQEADPGSGDQDAEGVLGSSG